MAKGHRNKNYAEDRMTSALDHLTELDNFRRDILPAIRRDLKSGMSAEDLYKKYEAHAAARVITTALSSNDESVAVSASRDVMDRTRGKATERKKIEHSLAQAKDEDLDALLLSKLKKLSDEDEEDDGRKQAN